MHQPSWHLAERFRSIYSASKALNSSRLRRTYISGQLLSHVGRELRLTINVQRDLVQSPIGLFAKGDEDPVEVEILLNSPATSLMFDLVVLKQVYEDYFRASDCIPRPGEVVVDIGANIGMYSILCALLQPAATVHSFEPLSGVAADLSVNCVLNGVSGRVMVNRAALGATEGEVSIPHIFNGRQGTLANDIPWDYTGGADLTPLWTLDAYSASRGFVSPDIIKLDVEGFELNVLQGAEDSLKNTRLLIAEWHSTDRRQRMDKILSDVGLICDRSYSDDLNAPVGIGYFIRS
jgi:FkbM family methyltransferase